MCGNFKGAVDSFARFTLKISNSLFNSFRQRCLTFTRTAFGKNDIVARVAVENFLKKVGYKMIIKESFFGLEVVAENALDFAGDDELGFEV
jgi:hypothetical protein